MLPEGYNSNLQIVQGEGYVAIMQEMIHDVRIIPTDGRPHLPADVKQLLGDSRGHWEGNTLVVDTTNFTNRTAFRAPARTCTWWSAHAQRSRYNYVPVHRLRPLDVGEILER